MKQLTPIKQYTSIAVVDTKEIGGSCAATSWLKNNDAFSGTFILLDSPDKYSVSNLKSVAEIPIRGSKLYLAIRQP